MNYGALPLVSGGLTHSNIVAYLDKLKFLLGAFDDTTLNGPKLMAG